jgi:integrase/recombinase XerD
MLREYNLAYKPKIWLFEGQISGEQYSKKKPTKHFKVSFTKNKHKKNRNASLVAT